jgi:hypothetical protein
MSYSESDSDVASVLSYSLENTNELMEEINEYFTDILDSVKCNKVLNLKEEMFKKLKINKDKLTGWVMNLCRGTRFSYFKGNTRNNTNLLVGNGN